MLRFHLRSKTFAAFAVLGVLALLPVRSVLVAQSRPTKGARIDAFMRRAAEYGQFNGAILVIDAGHRVYQGAFGWADREWRTPLTTDTRFEIASMTKPMTAITVMQLVQEGKIRLDGRVSDYVPYYPTETGNRITVRQLLEHTSGLPQDIAFDDPSPGADVVAAINGDLLSNDSLVKLIARRPLRFEPGSSYGYSSDGYAVLGAIVEHVTGRSYWDILRERVLDRVGMTETGVSILRPLVPKRASGYAQTFDEFENAPHVGVTPAGGLYSTLRDLYRFDQALYGETLVNEESKRLLFGLRTVITAYGWKTSEDTLPSGMRRRVLRTTGGLPGFAALMVRIPEARRTIIMLSNTRNMVWRFDDFAVAISHILDGLPYAMPRRSAAESIAAAVKAGNAGSELASRFRAMRADSALFDVTESEINRLGYYLLYQRRTPARAIDVFQLNVAAFPASANVYDSLGEAYVQNGDTALAVSNYRRSLELDPNNRNAVDVLKSLGAQSRP